MRAVRIVGLTRRDMLVRSGAVAGVVAGVPLVAGCGGGSGTGASSAATTAATTGGTSDRASAEIDRVDFVFPEIPLALDGARQVVQGNGVVLLGLEPLVLYDPVAKGGIAPNLATAFKQVDARTIAFTIRDGVTFWDGTPLTVDDVVFSLRYHVDNPKSLLRRWWDLTKSIEARGADRVVITLENPNPQFLYACTFTPIMQQAYAKQHRGDLGTPRVLNMGTGPWKFKTFVPDDRVELEANEDYWGGAPAVRNITVRLVGDSSTAVLALQAGDITGDFAVTGEEKARYEGTPGVRVQAGTNPEVMTFTINQTVKPWDDVHLRRAFQHAINREACVEGALAGNGRAAPQIVDPVALSQVMSKAQIDALQEAIAPDVAFDLDAARDELAQSSVPDGVSFTVQVAPQYAHIKRSLQIIAEDLQQIGITMKVKEVIDSVYVNTLTEGKFAVGAFTATPDSQSPLNLPAYFFPKDGAINYSKLDSPPMNATMARLLRTPPDDREQIGVLLSDAIKLNAKLAAYPSVWFADVILAIQDSYEFRDFNAFWWSTRWPSFLVDA